MASCQIVCKTATIVQVLLSIGVGQPDYWRTLSCSAGLSMRLAWLPNEVVQRGHLYQRTRMHSPPSLKTFPVGWVRRNRTMFRNGTGAHSIHRLTGPHELFRIRI
jgi:hypothetical protein